MFRVRPGRTQTLDGMYVRVGGSAVDDGLETAEEAALRELHEETGVDLSHAVERLRHVGDFEGEGRDPRDTPSAWSRSASLVSFKELHATSYADGPAGDSEAPPPALTGGPPAFAADGPAR